MNFLKAIIFGAILTGCVALVIGSQGSSGGQLAIYQMMIADQRMYWSWPIFITGSGLSWGMLWLQR